MIRAKNRVTRTSWPFGLRACFVLGATLSSLACGARSSGPVGTSESAATLSWTPREFWLPPIPEYKQVLGTRLYTKRDGHAWYTWYENSSTSRYRTLKAQHFAMSTDGARVTPVGQPLPLVENIRRTQTTATIVNLPDGDALLVSWDGALIRGRRIDGRTHSFAGPAEDLGRVDGDSLATALAPTGVAVYPDVDRVQGVSDDEGNILLTGVFSLVAVASDPNATDRDAIADRSQLFSLRYLSREKSWNFEFVPRDRAGTPAGKVDQDSRYTLASEGEHVVVVRFNLRRDSPGRSGDGYVRSILSNRTRLDTPGWSFAEKVSADSIREVGLLERLESRQVVLEPNDGNSLAVDVTATGDALITWVQQVTDVCNLHRDIHGKLNATRGDEVVFAARWPVSGVLERIGAVDEASDGLIGTRTAVGMDDGGNALIAYDKSGGKVWVTELLAGARSVSSRREAFGIGDGGWSLRTDGQGQAVFVWGNGDGFARTRSYTTTGAKNASGYLWAGQGEEQLGSFGPKFPERIDFELKSEFVADGKVAAIWPVYSSEFDANDYTTWQFHLAFRQGSVSP